MPGFSPLVVSSPEIELRRYARNKWTHRALLGVMGAGLTGAAVMAVLSRFQSQMKLIELAKQCGFTRSALVAGGCAVLYGAELLRYRMFGSDGLTGPQREHAADRLESHFRAIANQYGNGLSGANNLGVISGQIVSKAIGEELVQLFDLTEAFEEGGLLSDKALRRAWKGQEAVSLYVDGVRVRVFPLLLARLALAAEQYLEVHEAYASACESRLPIYKSRAFKALQRREAEVVYLLRLVSSPLTAEIVTGGDGVEEDDKAPLDFRLFWDRVRSDASLVEALRPFLTDWLNQSRSKDNT